MNTVQVGPEIRSAIEELERVFPGGVRVVDQDAAGVVVCVNDVELSSRWNQPSGELWFQIPFHYPDAAIYPYYILGAVPAGGHIGGLQPVVWRGLSVTQVSLRHNVWNPSHDTALGSVRQTMAWLRTQ